MLKLLGITKSYTVGNREVPILKGIDMSVAPGEFVAIMGPSGSGKSTLLHVMGGLDRPTSGEIIINGFNLAQLDDHGLARMRNETIGFVFQSFFLLGYYTALQNVRLPLIYSDKPVHAEDKAAALLDRFGLGNRLEHRPNELSGGEKQRVAIARALINDPSLIFADEPTGALDTKTGDSILETLSEINRTGTTIVLITHDPKVAQRAQRTVQISDGLVV